MECPTVKIKSDNEQGYVVINESDFDVTKHEFYVEGSTPAADVPVGVPAKDPSKMNKADLLAHLTSLEIEHDESMTKAELLGLLA